MCAQWKGIRQHLIRSIESRNAVEHFSKLKMLQPAIRPFESPAQTVTYFADKTLEPTHKQAILRVLVAEVQTGGQTRSLADALLWLGLWKGLDVVFCRRKRLFEEPRTLVQVLSLSFARRIRKADLSKNRPLAAELVRGTERDVLDERDREWRLANELKRFQDCQDAASLDNAASPSVFGIPDGFALDGQIRVIDRTLRSILGKDAELVERAALIGQSLREAGAEMGISHRCARKRYQRVGQRCQEGILEIV